MSQCFCTKCGAAHDTSLQPYAILLELVAALEGCIVHGMNPDARKRHDRFVAILNKAKRAVMS